MVQRALELYENYLSDAQRKEVTIAVAESAGAELVVVYHWDQRTADRIAGRLRKAGVATTGTSGDDYHAEVALYEQEPGALAIGISNSIGPCSACKKYFGELVSGYANVYWDDSAWIFP